ncbi:NAD(P)-dependent dehydrogenase (short-subunit alcohol dehydrogenase family) [Rhodoplanes tepidamans]|uniref:SDR family oxidoreductase n=1 Tax=Rhodoplanes tepidamans TaxID=200616 RepID=UPI0027850FBA|nr:SDR family oxidoreductase [Rhodoplanes tepidamans]MDQ0358891.1 NAD(P)-dependent dehydrogenase (short-subunit alcohol dehydrogenase family) [Rhodoplanes tepidamans]
MAVPSSVLSSVPASEPAQTREAPSPPVRAALVTGGAQRIGRAIVAALARDGWAVAVHARASAAEADALCAAITAAGGVARTVTADLADHAQVQRLVGAAAAAVGPLALLVNNASAFERDEIGALDGALFDLHMAVNLRAPVFLAEAFAAQVPAGADASVVNIVDQRVYKPTPRFISYGLSKSALHAATTTLAQALAPAVRVNAVAPGPTLPSPRQDAESFARQAGAVPLGRGPSPEEIADAVLYLARARSVTGETIAVDGGQRLAWQTPDAVGVEE